MVFNHFPPVSSISWFALSSKSDSDLQLLSKRAKEFYTSFSLKSCIYIKSSDKGVFI